MAFLQKITTFLKEFHIMKKTIILFSLFLIIALPFFDVYGAMAMPASSTAALDISRESDNSKISQNDPRESSVPDSSEDDPKESYSAAILPVILLLPLLSIGLTAGTAGLIIYFHKHRHH